MSPLVPFSTVLPFRFDRHMSKADSPLPNISPSSTVSGRILLLDSGKKSVKVPAINATTENITMVKSRLTLAYWKKEKDSFRDDFAIREQFTRLTSSRPITGAKMDPVEMKNEVLRFCNLVCKLIDAFTNSSHSRR